MEYKVTETHIPDLLILEPTVFGDERGFFMESYNEINFNQVVGREIKFVQDNHSQSAAHVLRGLHYQLEMPQAKLVRVVSGSVYDVVVDLRKKSDTFGKWFGIELSAEKKKQLWIPEGFAHGFVVLSERADFIYKTTQYYFPKSENCLVWNDHEVAIDWPIYRDLKISKKDQEGNSLTQLIKEDRIFV